MTESVQQIEVPLPVDLYEWAADQVARGLAPSVPWLCVEGLDALACLRSQRPGTGYAGLDEFDDDLGDDLDHDLDHDPDAEGLYVTPEELEALDPGRADRLAAALRSTDEDARKQLRDTWPGTS